MKNFSKIKVVLAFLSIFALVSPIILPAFNLETVDVVSAKTKEKVANENVSKKEVTKEKVSKEEVVVEEKDSKEEVVKEKVAKEKASKEKVAKEKASKKEKVSQGKTIIKLNKTKVKIQVGKTYTLKMIGKKKKVEWSSSDPTIATVSKTGKIKGITAGTAIITATYNNKEYTCKITIVSNKPADAVTGSAITYSPTSEDDK